ncbi:MAG TPA: hypothetical protein VL358_00190 [Caulobacteraceae bacterium]|jgi:hypothetical protein|nr:hypothetical protein [Caulobacteraceae bacterium]
MRLVVPLVVGLYVLVAGAALAATPDSAQTNQALFSAAFAAPSVLGGLSPGLGLGHDPLGEARYIPGRGLIRFTTRQVASFSGDGAAYVDTIRMSTAGYDPRPGAAFLRQGYAGSANGQSFDLAYERNWPQAFSLDTGRLTVDVTPHAGFGMLAGGGRSAEAGALVRLQQKVLGAVGMSGSGQSGRLYLFAGASEQALDLNLARAPNRLGPDPEDGYVREAQVGVGFQRGLVQASFGFSHQNMRLDSLGGESRIDNRVGLTVSIH